MSTVSQLAPPSLQPSPCPEHLDWLKHRQLLSLIPPARSWRGCLGLALLVADPAQSVTRGNRFLVPDHGLRWVSLVDIPPLHFHQSSRHVVPWASVHRTHMRFGMPTLGQQVLQAFDFGSHPFDTACSHGPSADQPIKANTLTFTQLFQVLHALHEAMTNAAFAFQPYWRARRDRFWKSLGEQSVSSPRWGESPSSRLSPPATWMPRAYLGFQIQQRDQIFAWSTCSGLATAAPYYPRNLKSRLCDDVADGLPIHAPCTGIYVGACLSDFHGLPTLDLVFIHTNHERCILQVTRQVRMQVVPYQRVREEALIGHDLAHVPAGWKGASLHDPWKPLQHHWGYRWEAWLRLWFERQVVTIQPNWIHVPAELAALAAKDHAVDEALHWDLAPAMNSYNVSIDAFLFPPLRTGTWCGFAGILPGDVGFDFTPQDLRFVPCSGTKKRYRESGTPIPSNHGDLSSRR